jgi:hypothetical protein
VLAFIGQGACLLDGFVSHGHSMETKIRTLASTNPDVRLGESDFCESDY